MDPTHFDRLTRSLLQPHSRRRALGLLALRLGGAPPVAAAPQPVHRHAKSAKRRCRAKGGRYFGPGACPCAALCPIAVRHSHFPCSIGPECICFASATGGAICGSNGVVDYPTGCATNADCIQRFGDLTPLCVLTPCGQPDGAACGPGQPPCPGGQACLSGQCRWTGCVTDCG
jgi:hypothetical protein